MTSRIHWTMAAARGTDAAVSSGQVSILCCGQCAKISKAGHPSRVALQVLNGAIAAALFNLLYDLVLSQKVKWYAMCPVVDFLNHKSTMQVWYSASSPQPPGGILLLLLIPTQRHMHRLLSRMIVMPQKQAVSNLTTA